MCVDCVSVGVCESVEGEEDHLMILQEQFLLLRKMMSDGASDGGKDAYTHTRPQFLYLLLWLSEAEDTSR